MPSANVQTKTNRQSIFIKEIKPVIDNIPGKKTDLEEFADEILNFKEESIHLSANGNRREKQRKYLEMNSVPLP